MKKTVFFFLAALIACTTDTVDDMEADQAVVLQFAPYELSVMGAETRGVTAIAEVVTRLDVWVINGGDTIAFHKTAGESGFGTVQATLNKTKTYQLVAVGHKADGAATLNDGVISFPNEKVTHSMVYTGTFCPGETTVLNCEMMRIVGMFRLETTDAVPDEVVTISFAFSGTGTRWDIAGTAANTADRETTIAITSTRQDGTVALSIYVMAEDLTTTETREITVQTLTAQGTVTNLRTFHEVPIKAGYKTTYRGNLFVNTPTAGSFMVGAWSEFEVREF